jgi:hypothetical protein
VFTKITDFLPYFKQDTSAVLRHTKSAEGSSGSLRVWRVANPLGSPKRVT